MNDYVEYMKMGQGLVNVPFGGDVEHHLQISVGIDIPNSWVMFNWDIYQPLWVTVTAHDTMFGR